MGVAQTLSRAQGDSQGQEALSEQTGGGADQMQGLGWAPAGELRMTQGPEICSLPGV